MKGELSYRRPETMTVKEIQSGIREMTQKINIAIMETEYKSTALSKEIKYLQIMRSGKEQEYDTLRYWFKGKKKAQLIKEYKELVRFSRFDRFTKKAQQEQETTARKAYNKFKKNRANIPGDDISFDDFMNLRNFFGNVTKDLIENFGYNEVMDVYDEVSDDAEKRKDLVMEMNNINHEFPEWSPADKLIELKDRLGLGV